MISAFSILLFTLLFLGHATSTPAIFDKHTTCIQDNCYRQLIHSSASAAQYCSRYLGPNTYTPDTTITTIVTVTTSLPLYMYTSKTLIEKRDAGESEQTAPSPTAPPKANAVNHLDERAVTTTSPPWSPSSCTPAPTAVSSGCSCFFQATFTTSTATVTKEAPIPTQCDAAHNYGMVTEGFSIFNFAGYYEHVYTLDIDDLPGGCCARCWGEPGCYAFSGSTVACLIWILANGTPQPQNSACPSGSVLVSLTQPNPTGGYDGLGPCGTQY